ncbi:hypothetical protein CXB51_003820 [Gossypium anomalum]|uniref:Myb/SANT-like domain-containing protein n=1 Tax=Gossypium anomalum TaxID=47600 RepID=A0A8J6DBT7_9ROSI|nr:hypothetical protein CXB51_003820 [Gossypium anomalum]
MSGFSPSSVSSQSSRGTKRKWVSEEDTALVACMVDLHNAGTFNADTGFKPGYLNELEKMLEKVLPNAMLKAKPNLESRIRTLKGIGQSFMTCLVEKIIAALVGMSIGSLLLLKMRSHKEAAQFRHWSFPYYDQLTAIYAKDRSTGKGAQIAVDIIEEINAEDVAATNTHEESNDFHGSEANVSLDDIDLSATQPQPARNQVEGLTEDERYRALSKISDHPTQMLIFFSLPSVVRLEWVRRVLADH